MRSINIGSKNIRFSNGDTEKPDFKPGKSFQVSTVPRQSRLHWKRKQRMSNFYFLPTSGTNMTTGKTSIQPIGFSLTVTDSLLPIPCSVSPRLQFHTS